LVDVGVEVGFFSVVAAADCDTDGDCEIGGDIEVLGETTLEIEADCEKDCEGVWEGHGIQLELPYSTLTTKQTESHY